MKRLLILGFAALIALPATALAADAPAPTQEQVKLRKADVKLARKVVVKRNDLADGWTKATIESGGDEGFACEGYAPDFSLYTITGHAESSFEHESGASIDSSVNVFKSRADAIGDYEAGIGPGFVECVRTTFEQAFAAVPEAKASVVSAIEVPAPNVGHRSYALQLVFLVDVDGTQVNVYFDVVIVQKGRTVTMLFFTNGLESMPEQDVLARRIAARMR